MNVALFNRFSYVIMNSHFKRCFFYFLNLFLESVLLFMLILILIGQYCKLLKYILGVHVHLIGFNHQDSGIGEEVYEVWQTLQQSKDRRINPKG